MSKRQATIHRQLSAAIVSALFLSVSAHAGLFGTGGVSTGLTGSVTNNMSGRLGAGALPPVMNPSTVNAATMNAANSGSAVVQPMGRAGAQMGSDAFGRANVGRSAVGQAGAMTAGEVTATQATAVPNGESITGRTERLSGNGQGTGNMAIEKAVDVHDQSVTGSARGSAQSSNGRATASGDARAQATVGY